MVTYDIFGILKLQIIGGYKKTMHEFDSVAWKAKVPFLRLL